MGRKSELTAYVKGRMYQLDLTQSKLSKKMGIPQQTFSYKMTHNSFTVAELGKMFRILDTPCETIGSLIKGEK